MGKGRAESEILSTASVTRKPKVKLEQTVRSPSSKPASKRSTREP
jgi:hypothetical protein